MIANREHRVPLSQRALDILAALPHEHDNPYIFVGAKRGQPLSGEAMREVALARGPGNLCLALGIAMSDNEIDLFDPAGPVTLTLNEAGRGDEAVAELMTVITAHAEVTDLGRYADGLRGLARWLADGRPD